MSIDNLLDRTWSKNYTCNEFACEAWQQITSENMTGRLKRFLNGLGGFGQFSEPISPCVVFFSNGKHSPTHVGVFFDNKVLHLSGRGVQYMLLDIVRIGFKEVRFYA